MVRDFKKWPLEGQCQPFYYIRSMPVSQANKFVFLVICFLIYHKLKAVLGSTLEELITSTWEKLRVSHGAFKIKCLHLSSYISTNIQAWAQLIR
jgi:intracellular septation protein A